MAKGNFGQSCIVMEFDRGIEEGWYRSIENCCQGHGQHSNHNENIWSHGQVRSSGPPQRSSSTGGLRTPQDTKRHPLANQVVILGVNGP